MLKQISSCLVHRTNTCGGFIWEYAVPVAGTTSSTTTTTVVDTPPVADSVVKK